MTNLRALRSRWTDQFKQLPNQSQFHERTRQLLCQGMFKSFKAYQEVPVDQICDYDNGSHRFDWYIPDLNVVIELHGEQHYKPTNRGNISYNKALQEFENGRMRDSAKKQAAIESGIKYVEIPYSLAHKLDLETLKQMVLND
jgi:very-short-patch-repair endonuclease